MERTKAPEPPGYYASAHGQTGAVLRLALHDIIKGHPVIPYDALREIGRFFKADHAVIIPLTVREILDEQIARKLA